MVGDLHIPYSDDKAIRLLWNFIDSYEPDRVVIAGDLIDFYHVSRFLTHPKYGKTAFKEIESAKKFLEKLRDKCPKAIIDFVEGNHDYRLRKYILENSESLLDFDVLELPHLLDLPKLRIAWHPIGQYATSFVDSWITVRKFHIGHFHKANRGSGMTARNLMQRGGSFVQAHTHRAGMIFKRNIDGKMEYGIECPCLYDFKKAPYLSDPDWQKGWVTITDGHPELVIVEKNEYVYGGKLHRLEKNMG